MSEPDREKLRKHERLVICRNCLTPMQQGQTKFFCERCGLTWRPNEHEQEMITRERRLL